MDKKKGRVLIAGGLLLIAAALFLTCYNLWDAERAAQTARETLRSLESWIDENRASAPEDLSEDPRQTAEQERPLYEKYPDMEMPTVLIDGQEYIGTLEIPVLDRKLPIMSEWSYPGLRIAPCRYQGSVYSHDLIIAGHNYAAHFGDLKSLLRGDELLFTDADGNQFRYEVAEIETLPGTAVKDMEAGTWDLTLFTCTYGGQSRITIRCRVQES